MMSSATEQPASPGGGSGELRASGVATAAIARKPRVVYTAVFGGYDEVAPVDPTCDCDFICITDSPSQVAPGWTVVVVDRAGEPPAMANRRYKMLAHRYFAGYDQSLYVDGRVEVRRCPRVLFDRYLGRFAIAIPMHADRDCAFDEAQYCVRDGLLDAAATERQLAEYAALGFPRNFGLTENNVVLRRHNDPDVVALMEQWWNEYSSKVRRDQISLPFLLWRHGIDVGEIEEGPRRTGRYFRLKPHARAQASWIKAVIWYITTNRRRNAAYRVAYGLYRLVSLPLGR